MLYFYYFLRNFFFKSQIIALIRADDSFFLKYGEDNLLYIFNMSDITPITFSKNDNASWIWFYFGYKYDENIIYVSLSTKYEEFVFFSISLLSISMSFNCEYNELNIGMSFKFDGFCMCQMKYFIFYYNEVSNNYESTKEKFMNKFISKYNLF